MGDVADYLGLKDYIKTLSPNGDEYLKLKQKLQDEMLKVEVFFRSLNLQIIQEQPKYDVRKILEFFLLRERSANFYCCFPL